MGFNVEPRRYEMNLTAVAGGSVGAFAAAKLGDQVARSPWLAAGSDSVAAGVGGRMRKVPQILAGALGSAAARSHGADDTASALGAHLSRKAARHAPTLGDALGAVADGASNKAVRAAAGAGAFALHEAPGAVGAVAGAKLLRPVPPFAVRIGSLAAGAIIGGLLLQSVAPAITWTNGTSTGATGAPNTGGN